MDKRPPSILHAIDTTGPGGAETVFLDLAENLKLEGYNSVAVIKGPGWVEDQLRARGIHYYIVKPSSGFSIAYYRALAKIIRDNNVKLVQAHLLGSTLTYSILGLILRIPVVATLHGKVDVNPNEKLVFLKNLIIRLGTKKLIAVSKSLSHYIAERGLLNQEKIGIIYNGIDTKKYGKNSAEKIRQKFGLSQDAILVGSVGNIRPAKDYRTLIHAASLAVKNMESIHFIIAGHKENKLMSELDRLIADLNLESNIHFIGFEENISYFLGQMDFFCLSSSSEGFSISTIEALATGLPVISTRCGGPEEIITDNSTGVLVNTENPAELNRALLDLINNPAKKEAFSLAGQEHVKKHFDKDMMLEEYSKEYRILLETKQ